MAKGKKTKEETKAKVTELKFNNPDLSSYDIAEQLKGTEWEVSHDTICRIITDLQQLATTERWQKQIERLDSIIDWIELITAKVVKKLSEQEEHTVNDVKTLNDISKTNWERLRLLQDKSTLNVNVLWDVLKEIQGI